MHEVLAAVLFVGAAGILAAYLLEGIGFAWMLWNGRRRDGEFLEDDEAFM